MEETQDEVKMIKSNKIKKKRMNKYAKNVRGEREPRYERVKFEDGN